jgi:hypothetical protein
MGEFCAFVCIFVFGIFLGVNSSFVRVTQEEWNKSESYCATNEGIAKFIAKPLDDNSVECKNTARFKLKEEKK